MIRTTRVLVFLAAFISIVGHSRADDTPDAPALPLNQDHEGDLEGRPTWGCWGCGNFEEYSTIQLKAGHSVTIQLHVLGSGRGALIALYDSTDAQLGLTRRDPTNTTLKIDEVSYTGSYKLRVGSDRIGEYTVRVTADEDDTVESIQAKIDALQQELSALQDKLKAIKAKLAAKNQGN